jgi:hypothetical protein
VYALHSTRDTTAMANQKTSHTIPTAAEVEMDTVIYSFFPN